MKRIHLKFFGMIIFIIFYSENIHSQNPVCGNTESNHSKQTDVVDCSKTSDTWTNIYKIKEHYIPGSDVPVKTLHVNLNIWQRSDGTGNLSNIPQHITRLEQIMEWVNLKYENVNPNANPPLSYSVESYTDSKIRIVLDNIYFYRDPSSNNSYYYGNYYGHNVLLDNYIKNNFPERTKALNIHLTGGEYGGAAGYSDFGSIESFYRHNPDMADDPVHDWWFSEHWAHEIGHSFDLWHTYDLAPSWKQNCFLSYYDFLTDLYDITIPCSSGCDICLITDDNNNLMGGAGEGHITGLQMGIIHRSTMLRNLHNVNYNLRDHVTGYTNTPYEITQNETWDFSIKFYQDIIVKAGNTLTVQCEVQMVPNAKIIVEPNAKLIIDGGTITNEAYYDQPWQGIEVWGNSSAHQYPDVNGNYQQGYVELKNGAVIENAWEAIQPWNPGHWNQTGGIIKANGATFRNNRRAVQFMSYENFDPATGEHRPNQSIFRNCTFETTSVFDEIFGESPFHTFVSMYKVDGVKYYGCDFNDSRTEWNVPFISSVGLWGLDANFLVLPNCKTPETKCWQCEQNDLDKSTFYGLLLGIYASQSSTNNTFVVDRTDFKRNFFSVFNVSNDFSSCIRSKFEVGTKNPNGPSSYPPSGIVNNGSSGFNFEQNTFSVFINPPSENIYYVGIWNINTGEDINTIYNNNFTDLDFANTASGDNHNNAFPERGLQYQCNKNSANRNLDFFIWGTQDEGIATYQGSSNQAAGNTFSLKATPEGSDFYNETIWPVNYYYYTGDPDQNPLNIIGLWKKGTNQNSCLDHYGPYSDIRYSEAKLNSLRQQYYFNKDEYNNTRALYEILKDGGNTFSTKLDIETSWPNETWELRAQLLADSPHLSEEVLKAAADKTDVLPHTIMFEICIANPEEMRNIGFLEYLATKSDPMPQYMIDDIRAGANEDTYKSVLQNEMADYAYLWGTACNDLIRDIALDSTGIDYDSLRFWINKKGTLNSEYEIVDTYLAQENFTLALQKLADIPNNYSLSGKQLDEYNYFFDLKTLLISAEQNGRNELQLDSLEVVDLVFIADSSQSIAGLQAQSILNFGYGFNYFKLNSLPDPNLKQSSIQDNKNLGKGYRTSEYHLINAYPNPANEWVSFNYTLPLLSQSPTIEIFNINGTLVGSLSVQQPNGQVIFDTRTFPSGVYFYNLKVRGFVLEKRKLLISK